MTYAYLLTAMAIFSPVGIWPSNTPSLTDGFLVQANLLYILLDFCAHNILLGLPVDLLPSGAFFKMFLTNEFSFFLSMCSFQRSL